MAPLYGVAGTHPCLVTEVSEGSLRDVERGMIDKYSQLAPAQVSTVGKASATFAESRVQDFVPLLVERRVQRELTHCVEMLRNPATRGVVGTVSADYDAVDIA
jgi:hypothetical protein